MHFFSPANVMRLLEIVRGREDVEIGPRDRRRARAEDRQGRGGGRRLPRLRRQPDAGRAPARGDEAHPRRRDAMGRRPRARRFRHADGAVRDERPRGPRHRLVGRDVEALHASATSCARRAGAARRPAPASTTTTRRATPNRRRMSRQIIRDFAASKGVEQRKIADAEILERCTYPMINEGAKILAEGKAQRASDIDIVWIYGYGWPVYRGGPMFYADTVGPEDGAGEAAGVRGQVRRRTSSPRRCWRRSRRRRSFSSVKSAHRPACAGHLLPRAG